MPHSREEKTDYPATLPQAPSRRPVGKYMWWLAICRYGPVQCCRGWTGPCRWALRRRRGLAVAGRETPAAGVIRAREPQVVLGDDRPEHLDRAAGGRAELRIPVAEFDDAVADRAVRAVRKGRGRADQVDEPLEAQPDGVRADYLAHRRRGAGAAVHL